MQCVGFPDCVKVNRSLLLSYFFTPYAPVAVCVPNPPHIGAGVSLIHAAPGLAVRLLLFRFQQIVKVRHGLLLFSAPPLRGLPPFFAHLLRVFLSYFLARALPPLLPN